VSAPGTAGLRARNLRTLGVLAALFLLPLVLAFFTYYGTAWRPAGHVNHGTLISPPHRLPQARLPRVRLEGQGAPADDPAPVTPFRGKWSLVYVGAGNCDTACRGALYLMRQTRLALNNDMTRVERVFLVSGGGCAGEFLAREHPGLLVLDAQGAAGAALLGEFPERERAYTLYIVDPLGNLMMSYDARQDPHGLLEDLKKLLRLSHIG
jgi:cytochrome oxidase Cu insertion factor (SCO1/SenC/PrrC family)